MCKFAFVALMILASPGIARSAPACSAEIDKTQNDWQALRLEPVSKPGAISRGVGSHAHVQAAVTSMRYHLKKAQELCKSGNDHEALLHLDVLRAFLNVPEIQHPIDHHYLLQNTKGS